MIRNLAGQVITAALTNRMTGFPVVSGVVTVEVLGNGGTKTGGLGTIENEGGGTWSYFPTQAETDYAAITFSFTHADAVNVDVQVHTELSSSSSPPSIIVPVGGGAYRTRILTRLNVIAEELAVMDKTKMGGLANIKNQDGGTHVDHVGYRMSLLKEQEMLLRALDRADEVDDGADGYGPFEIITRVDT